MTADAVCGWRDRAIALAGLGAAAVSRSAFATLDDTDPPPLQMQIALQDSMLADTTHRTGTDWLSTALRLEQDIVEQLVTRLGDRNLVFVRRDVDDEILWELGEDPGDDDKAAGDDDEAAGERPIALTEHGHAIVARWLRRVRWQFAGWRRGSRC